MWVGGGGTGDALEVEAVGEEGGGDEEDELLGDGEGAAVAGVEPLDADEHRAAEREDGDGGRVGAVGLADEVDGGGDDAVGPEGRADDVLEVGGHDLERHGGAEAGDDGVGDEGGDEVEAEDHHGEVHDAGDGGDGEGHGNALLVRLGPELLDGDGHHEADRCVDSDVHVPGSSEEHVYQGGDDARVEPAM